MLWASRVWRAGEVVEVHADHCSGQGQECCTIQALACVGWGG